MNKKEAMSKPADKFDAILTSIAEGKTVSEACRTNDLAPSKFYDYLDQTPAVREKYARACDARAEIKFESIEQDYSEQPERDPETGKIDTGWVQLQRLKIDAKKWELSKLQPKKYGDKLDIDHTTGGEKLIFTPINLDVKE